jgi:hypothetical protein
MFIKISVESDKLIERTKRDKSGTYMVQEAWAYTYGPNGLHPHPERIEMFPPKESGTPKAYPVGEYVLSPDSMSVKYGRFDVFTRLIPFQDAIKQVREMVAQSKAA